MVNTHITHYTYETHSTHDDFVADFSEFLPDSDRRDVWGGLIDRCEEEILKSPIRTSCTTHMRHTRHITHYKRQTHLCVVRESHSCRNIHVTHMNASCHTYECAMSYISMRHVTHMNASCHACQCVMSHI